MRENKYGRRGIAAGVTSENRRTISRAREAKGMKGSIRNGVAVIVIKIAVESVKQNVVVVEQSVAVEELNVVAVEVQSVAVVVEDAAQNAIEIIVMIVTEMQLESAEDAEVAEVKTEEEVVVVEEVLDTAMMQEMVMTRHKKQCIVKKQAIHKI